MTPPSTRAGPASTRSWRSGRTVATVASEIPLREFVPPTGDGPPQFVVERPDDQEPLAGEIEAGDRLEPVARTDEPVVCRVSDDAECDHEWCPACDLGGLPLDPLEIAWENGELRLHVAAEDGDGVRRGVDAISDEFEVSPVRLSTTGGSLGESGRRAVGPSCTSTN